MQSTLSFLNIPYLVYFQPTLLFAHHVPTTNVCMLDVTMEESPANSRANVIEPDTEEDFLPKSIPDKHDITTIPEK